MEKRAIDELIDLYFDDDSKYESLRFFIKETCNSVSDLETFDYQNLFFLPNFDDSLITEVQHRIAELLSFIHKEESASNSSEEIEIEPTIEHIELQQPEIVEELPPNDYEKKLVSVSLDAVFGRLKKGNLFIKNRVLEGKHNYNDLDFSDFLEENNKSLVQQSLDELYLMGKFVVKTVEEKESIFIPLSYFIKQGLIRDIPSINPEISLFDYLYLEQYSQIGDLLYSEKLLQCPDFSLGNLWDQLLCCFSSRVTTANCKTILECTFNEGKLVDDVARHLVNNGIITVEDYLTRSTEETKYRAGASKTLIAKLDATIERYLNRDNEQTKEHITLNVNSKYLNMSVNDFLFKATDRQFFIEKGINKISDFLNKNDGIVFFRLREYIKILESDPVDYYYSSFISLKPKEKDIISQRGKGKTLDAIAANHINDETGKPVTRERIRQIESTAIEKLFDSAWLLTSSLLCLNDGIVEKPQLFDLFLDEDATYSLLVCLKEMKDLGKPFKFCNKFISYKYAIDDYKNVANYIRNDIIGEYCHLNEKRDEIEDYFSIKNLACINADDFASWLIQNHNYHCFGDDFLVKSTQYRYLCHDVVLRFFDYDISLDISDSNPDMDRMRTLVEQEYGVTLPDNRSLYNRLTGTTDLFCLNARGRYLPVERVSVDEEAISAILDYVEKSGEPTLYYREIYENLKGYLLIHSSITNPSALHGVLLMYCPDSYTYGRDKLTKLGQKKKGIDERVIDFIHKNNDQVPFEVVRNQFSEFPHWVLEQVIGRQDSIVLSTDNTVFFFDSSVINTNDLKKITDSILSIVQSSGGFIIGQRLFPLLMEKEPGIMNHYSISDWCLLVPIVKQDMNDLGVFTRRNFFYLSEKYGKSPSVYDLFFAYYNDKETISVQDIMDFSSLLCIGTAASYQLKSNIQTELAKRYYRVDEKRFIKNSLLETITALNTQAFIPSINIAIEKELNTYSFVGLYSITDYSKFPPLNNEYRWNAFLLETILNRLDGPYIVIYPFRRDGNYSTGVVTQRDKYTSFLNLAEFIISQSSIRSFADCDDLNGFLSDNGLRYGLTENEIAESKTLVLEKNGSITVNF